MPNKVFDALAIQQELNKVEGKAEKSYVDNEIKNVNNKLNEVNTSLEEKANEVDLQTQKARIDSFTSLAEGSTTGDAELIDARTVNGKTQYSGYSSTKSITK